MKNKAVYGLMRYQVIEQVEVFDGSELYEARAKLYSEAAGAAQWEKIQLSDILGFQTYPTKMIMWRHGEFWTNITPEAHQKLKAIIEGA